MAEFCKDCSIEIFGEDLEDFAGMTTSSDTEKGLGTGVLCEGCGWVVDHEGKRHIIVEN